MRQKRIQSQRPKRILGEKADTKADYLCISWCYHTGGEWSRCPRGDNHSYWWCYVQQYSEGGEAGATKHKEIRNSSRNFRLSWSFSYHHICILMICTKKQLLFFGRNLALTISIQLSHHEWPGWAAASLHGLSWSKSDAQDMLLFLMSCASLSLHTSKSLQLSLPRTHDSVGTEEQRITQCSASSHWKQGQAWSTPERN